MSRRIDKSSIDAASSSFTLKGGEAPISKLLNPMQVHSDYSVSPLRMSGSFVLNPHLPKAGYDASKFPDKKKLPINLAEKLRPPVIRSPGYQKITEIDHSPSTNFSAERKPKLDASQEPITPVLRAENLVLKCRSESILMQTSQYDIHLDALSRSLAHDYSLTDNRLKKQNFVPYTLKDYRKIEHLSRKRLGGLGPVSLGSADWEVQMKKKLRMAEYSHKVTLPRVTLCQDPSKSFLNRKV